MRPQLNLEDELNQLFDKKFEYRKPSPAWVLAQSDSFFNEFYQFETLQRLKDRLNAEKSRLNNYGTQEWSAHTNRREPTCEISWRLRKETKAEFVTVAWCKFFECLHRYPLVKTPQLNTLHICEAPGAFIAALNHYLHSTYEHNEIKWDWRSTTLNPYYEGNPLNEMIIDDRFIFYTLDNWNFHDDFTGNLLNINNIDYLASRCSDELNGGVQLITADGSVDCAAQPDCQEEIVSRLFYAEIISALTILNDGGNFLIKMFTLFEAFSVSIMYMLNCIFNEVHICKPATSKRGNSEVYVICLDYKKNTKGLDHILESMRTKLKQTQDVMVTPLFPKSEIPIDFLQQHEVACRLYMNLQCSAIDQSIYAFESNDRKYFQHLHVLRGLVADMYYTRYKVTPLADEFCVVSKEQTSRPIGFVIPVYGGSYTERENLKHCDLFKQIYYLRRELNQVEKHLKGEPNYIYKGNDTEMPLKIGKGSPIDKLQSSLFTIEAIVLLRFRIISILQIDPLWQMDAKCVLSTNNKSFTYLPTKKDEPFHKTQQIFFVALLKALLNDKPNQLIFYNFPFLTHYAVSILLILAHILYECAEFDNNRLVLSGLKESELFKLEALLSLVATDDRNHCFVHIKELHRNDFNTALMQYNNTVCLDCYRRMLGEEAFPRPMIIAETENVEN